MSVPLTGFSEGDSGVHIPSVPDWRPEPKVDDNFAEIKKIIQEAKDKGLLLTYADMDEGEGRSIRMLIDFVTDNSMDVKKRLSCLKVVRTFINDYAKELKQHY